MKQLSVYVLGLFILVSSFFLFSDTHPLIVSKNIKDKVNFVSDQNGLGIIRFDFGESDFKNIDTIQIKLADKKSREIIKEEKIKIDKINNGIYDFGFPLVENSKGRTYEIHVSGETPDAVIAKYKKSTGELLTNPYGLFKYASDKITYTVSDSRLLSFALWYTVFFIILTRYRSIHFNLKIPPVNKKYIGLSIVVLMSIFFNEGLMSAISLLLLFPLAYFGEGDDSDYTKIAVFFFVMSFVMTLADLKYIAELSAIVFYQILVYFLIKEAFKIFKTKNV